MRIRMNCITILLAAGAAGVAIAAAPLATAAVSEPAPAQLSCTYTGGGFQDNQCQTPGNAQINDSPPPVLPMPQYFGGDTFGLFSGPRGHR
jgi:hypothetical protein